MKEAVEILAIVLIGPLVGVEFGVAAFTNPVVARLPDDAFRVARGGSGRLLGLVMPFWYIGALIVLIAAAVIEPRGWLPGAAVGLMVLALLLTVTVLVPINNRIGAWRSVQDVSRGLARRWDRLHWVRVALLAGVFVLLALGAGR